MDDPESAESTDLSDLLRVRDAARVLDVSEQTARRWLRDGTLPGARTALGWLCRPADVRRLKRQRQLAALLRRSRRRDERDG